MERRFNRRNEHLLSIIAFVFLAALWFGMGKPRDIRPEPRSVGFWRIEGGETNLVQCYNPSSTTVRMLIDVFNEQGLPLGSAVVKMLPLETAHTVLNKIFAGKQASSHYGSYHINQLLRKRDKPQLSVTCRTLITAVPPLATQKSEEIQFSYFIPTVDIADGFRSGIASVPSNERDRVTFANFVMIYNRGPNGLAGTLEAISSAEQESSDSVSIKLKKGAVGRYDLSAAAIGDTAEQIYHVVPEAADSSYAVVRPQYAVQ